VSQLVSLLTALPYRQENLAGFFKHLVFGGWFTIDQPSPSPLNQWNPEDDYV
jgi:hypothetical protein